MSLSNGTPRQHGLPNAIKTFMYVVMFGAVGVWAGVSITSDSPKMANMVRHSLAHTPYLRVACELRAFRVDQPRRGARALAELLARAALTRSTSAPAGYPALHGLSRGLRLHHGCGPGLVI